MIRFRETHPEAQRARTATQFAREELARRGNRTLRTLHLDASPDVRFFGAARRPQFRVTALESYREAYRVAQVLRMARRSLGRSVPRVWLDWLDDHVVVTEFVPGRVKRSLGPARLCRAARLLARLHNVCVSHRRDLGPMRSCFADRLDGLVAAARAVPRPKRPRGFQSWRSRYTRLKRRLWPRAIIHGDPHEENFIWRRCGSPTLIDWDLAQAGAPHFDLAYLLLWRGYTLIGQRRFGAWLRTIELVLAAYNHSARRGRISLRDLLAWIGCLALGYVGHGIEVGSQRYVAAAPQIWDALDVLAADHELSLV